VAKRIIKEGDIQLTTEFRRKRKEEKERQIADFISRHGVDPRTKKPHPPERILAAMDKAHVNIDPFKPAEQQIEDVLKSIKAILPISFENVKLTIEILPQFSGKAYSILKEFAHSGDEQWLSDGTLRAKIEIPASLKDSLYRKLNAATGGTVRITES
jgi:ribosome maturation protein SDO1